MQPSSKRQIIFRDMTLGILVYAVVLGFFADYTDILFTKSYSTTFAVAITMQTLTYLTFLVKDNVIQILKNKNLTKHKLLVAFCIWFVMFISKFIFLAVIDILFGASVEISGFVGLLLIIASVTIATNVLLYAQNKLGTVK